MADVHFRFHDFDRRHELEVRVQGNINAGATRAEIAELRAEGRRVQAELRHQEERSIGIGNEIGGMRGEIRDAREELRMTGRELWGTRVELSRLRNEGTQNRGDLRGLRQEILDLEGEIVGFRGEMRNEIRVIREMREEVLNFMDEVERGQRERLRDATMTIERLRREVMEELIRRDANNVQMELRLMEGLARRDTESIQMEVRIMEGLERRDEYNIRMERRLMGEVQDLKTRNAERSEREDELINDVDNLRSRNLENERAMRGEVESLGNRIDALALDNGGLMERVTWLETPGPEIEEDIEPLDDQVVNDMAAERYDKGSRKKHDRARCKWPRFCTGSKKHSIGKDLALRILKYTVT
ncbi:uncharacterized protein EAE97_001935 [Botrytis byssoidea]|uniref:Uncharacterized protein n=1 Tax=Botrytis byssoidea TaxID=139641 RepID=A0A9P5IW54_9HELO|nr:uncharacterized protein EAE97_001935 [Botrytis byssoidea]KAF7952438.1 hypothetical protein EAE97_001935 [Botrytis byssoidea]